MNEFQQMAWKQVQWHSTDATTATGSHSLRLRREGSFGAKGWSFCEKRPRASKPMGSDGDQMVSGKFRKPAAKPKCSKSCSKHPTTYKRSLRDAFTLGQGLLLPYNRLLLPTHLSSSERTKPDSPNKSKQVFE